MSAPDKLNATRAGVRDQADDARDRQRPMKADTLQIVDEIGPPDPAGGSDPYDSAAGTVKAPARSRAIYQGAGNPYDSGAVRRPGAAGKSGGSRRSDDHPATGGKGNPYNSARIDSGKKETAWFDLSDAADNWD